jgi:hypothetical protein
MDEAHGWDGENRNAQRVPMRKIVGKRSFGRPRLYGRIILKLINKSAGVS